jgi:hypothetical protein
VTGLLGPVLCSSHQHLSIRGAPENTRAGQSTLGCQQARGSNGYDPNEAVTRQYLSKLSAISRIPLTVPKLSGTNKLPVAERALECLVARGSCCTCSGPLRVTRVSWRILACLTCFESGQLRTALAGVGRPAQSCLVDGPNRYPRPRPGRRPSCAGRAPPR